MTAPRRPSGSPPKSPSGSSSAYSAQSAGLNIAPDVAFDPAATPLVEVRRSARRRRTVSAYRDGDRIVVLIPQRFSRAQEREYVEKMVGQLSATEARRQQRSRSRSSDEALMARVRQLSERYLDGRAYPTSIRWVPAMRTRWASCTPLDGSIRVSTRLQQMPDWVLDYVLVHELVHLQVPGHGPEFWALVANYPRTERARGYLDGVSAAAHLDIVEDGDDTTDSGRGDLQAN
ncbi:M48 family metallopeptidase [Jatrophihabitans sp. GAS493]|uniref:M48 metallopeptidase family protein n=1 Tax=Jatrophihabitans sp. GAS493 TaxID=1907575 RepID=UPI001F52D62F|nr:M48 family metallopeptidase [Jatrophihabitans sp. GAS493]